MILGRSGSRSQSDAINITRRRVNNSTNETYDISMSYTEATYLPHKPVKKNVMEDSGRNAQSDITQCVMTVGFLKRQSRCTRAKRRMHFVVLHPRIATHSSLSLVRHVHQSEHVPNQVRAFRCLSHMHVSETQGIVMKNAGRCSQDALGKKRSMTTF